MYHQVLEVQEELEQRRVERMVPSATVQGKLVKVSIPKPFNSPPPKKTGSIIRGFSPASRLRLLKYIATVRWDDVPRGLFITLTYPDDKVVHTMRQRAIHRYVFMRYLEKFAGVPLSAVWRVEWVDRKSGERIGEIVPHMHIIVLGCPMISKVRVRHWWQQTIGEKEYADVDIEPLEEGSKAAVYISYYLGKPCLSEDLGNLLYLNKCGRHYGYLRKAGIPRHDVVKLGDLSQEELWIFVKAAARKIPDFDWRNPGSFSLIGMTAETALEELKKFWFDKMGKIC